MNSKIKKLFLGISTEVGFAFAIMATAFLIIFLFLKLR